MYSECCCHIVLLFFSATDLRHSPFAKLQVFYSYLFWEPLSVETQHSEGNVLFSNLLKCAESVHTFFTGITVFSRSSFSV